MRGGALFKGKEGRGDFRKNSTVGRLHPLSPEVSVPRKRGNRRGGVKTIEKGLGESGGASLKGKGGWGGRKILIDFIKVTKNIVIIHQLP